MPARGLISALAALTAFDMTPVKAESLLIPCRVVGVADGDTLTCLTEAKQQIKVRLAQIDAPEKAQPFGQRSKQALSGFVFGQQVILKVETTDRYGRTVAKVVKSGQDVNLAMVRTGMAWVYDRYARDPEYFSTQAVARAARTGLWADASPVQPSEWRHGGDAPAGGMGVSATIVEQKTVKPVSAKSEFRCGSKRTCGQMTSCEEAHHYLTACGLTRLDRNRDGMPCEALCQ